MNENIGTGNKRWYILLSLIGIGITIWVFVTGKNLPDIIRTPTTIPCPYHGESDQATFRNLIITEHTAAKTKNMDIIKDIFLPDAKLTDQSNPIPMPLIEYYQKKFDTADFPSLELYDLQVLENDGKTAKITSSGSGIMILKDTGQQIPFEWNEGYSIVKRDENGCWKFAGVEE